MRKKIVAGNWKMNMELGEGVALATGLNKYFLAEPLKNKEVIICTPFIHLGIVISLLSAPGLSSGAQNCNDHKSGAYTGEISAAMIRSTGASSVIIGHSERRTYYGEDDTLLAAKTAEALRNGLMVIFCSARCCQREKAVSILTLLKDNLKRGCSSSMKKISGNAS